MSFDNPFLRNFAVVSSAVILVVYIIGTLYRIVRNFCKAPEEILPHIPLTYHYRVEPIGKGTYCPRCGARRKPESTTRLCERCL